MLRISGNKMPVPGTPGTQPGTRKRPLGAALYIMFPVFPVKIQSPYAREKFILGPSATQIKFSAYITSKITGNTGNTGNIGPKRPYNAGFRVPGSVPGRCSVPGY